jgi:hypothetical protein
MCYYDSYFTSFVVPEENGDRCMWSSDEAMYFDPTASAITAKDIVNAVPFVKFAFTEDNAVEEMTSASFNVYPNPVNDKLVIETEEIVKEVVVYDVYGRQQDNKTTRQQGNLSVDVTNLNSGVYFVKVVTENGEAVQRFIKK